MKETSSIAKLMVLIPLILAIAACSSGSSSSKDPVTNDSLDDPVIIGSLVDTMTRIIPTTGSSGPIFADWENWNPNTEGEQNYRLLGRMFNEDEGSAQSIFFGPVMVDEITSVLSTILRESDLKMEADDAPRTDEIEIDEDGENITLTVAWQRAPASVSLPDWTGLPAVTDFQIEITVYDADGADGSEQNTTIFYFRDADGDKLLGLFPFIPENEGFGRELVYAERSFVDAQETKVWSGYAAEYKEASEGAEVTSLSNTYVELDDTTFRFAQKFSQGGRSWLVFGGGVGEEDNNGDMIPEESYMAVRMIDEIDDIFLDNTRDVEGEGYTVILSYADFLDATYDGETLYGGGTYSYPIDDATLASGTHPPFADLVRIPSSGEMACIFATENDLADFEYPTLENIFP
ncbi:hypothetical protein [Desulfurivibrio dismutans]|uniref:hypothetical protein n=1 Tax=Desulfurivibrio dismutans TaxID=1398908 RepID=UPI0023D99CCE|nr:hypothetical protein [Desulfurivibrio alkaliphilus]MDF1614063.1 hypothetical protein [Desulfurivibrio alkaliphilus]